MRKLIVCIPKNEVDEFIKLLNGLGEGIEYNACPAHTRNELYTVAVSIAAGVASNVLWDIFKHIVKKKFNIVFP